MKADCEKVGMARGFGDRSILQIEVVVKQTLWAFDETTNKRKEPIKHLQYFALGLGIWVPTKVTNQNDSRIIHE